MAAGIGALERLDVLVNNAGGAIGLSPVEAATSPSGRRCTPPTSSAPCGMTQAALPLLRSSPRATIVERQLHRGERVYAGGGGYTAAKHGESVVSETLRLELNGSHVRVIDVRPGMVQHRGVLARPASTATGRPPTRSTRASTVRSSPTTSRPCVAFAVGLPQHVNIDTLVVKPVAQAAPHLLHRGPIDWQDGS